MVKPIWRTVRQFLAKLNTVFAYNPATVLLGIYSIDFRTTSTENLHANIIAVLFIITGKFYS